jgi:hypothetical protein
MNTRANAAGRSTKAVQNVAVTNSPEYEVPTEGANGVSAKVIDWPDTDRAPTIVEIDGVRFTRGSEQVTVIGRIEPGGHNGGQVVAAEIDGTILVRWRPGRNELPTGGSVLVLEASVLVLEAAAVSWGTLERSAVRMAVVAMRPALER